MPPTISFAADDQHPQDQGAPHSDQAPPRTESAPDDRLRGASDQPAHPDAGGSYPHGAGPPHGTAHAQTHHGAPHGATKVHVQIDITAYRRNVTAQHPYHFGDYRAPPGYAYHRYGFGDHLPQAYYVRDYWIVNFLNFGLVTPPDDYVWVRYGPDAILIDEDTGEIVQVVYDQFY